MTTTQLTVIGSILILTLMADIALRSIKKRKRVWKKGDVIKATVERVIDGDTLKLHGYNQSIRTWGIDAVERGQTGYTEAGEYLAKLCFDKKIICVVVGNDTKWNRIVARCFLPGMFGGKGKEINAMMLRNRYVREDTKYSKGFYANANKSPYRWAWRAVVIGLIAAVYFNVDAITGLLSALPLPASLLP